LSYDGDLENDLYVNFQVTYEVFGEQQVYNLVVFVETTFVH
jgi:hypothetical protein